MGNFFFFDLIFFDQFYVYMYFFKFYRKIEKIIQRFPYALYPVFPIINT